MRDGRMHQTTVRFGPDLWEALEAECSRLGMSAAQFLREAALARLAYTAGQLGDHGFARAFGDTPADVGRPLAIVHAGEAQASSSEEMLASSAVAAEARIAQKRAREVREQSIDLRRRIKERLR